MNLNDKNFVIHTARFSHGTATPVSIPSAVPENKQEKEKFWVSALISKLPEFEGQNIEIISNPDDSLGGHDAILFVNEGEIGIQVTELTSELKRNYEHVRQKYLRGVFSLLESHSIKNEKNILISVFFSTLDINIFKKFRPSLLTKIIVENINNITKTMIIKFDYGTILFEMVGENKFFVPSIRNIGIDINIDQIPLSYEAYKNAIDYLEEKKRKSKSPWLLIWSLDFWILRENYDNQVLDYLKEAFSSSKFQKVYFIESLGAEGLFNANLTLHCIKE